MTPPDVAAVHSSLAAWRADSLRPARPAAISSARAAMLGAVSSSRQHPLRSVLGLRPRRPHGLFAGALAGAAACVAVGVAAIGWNSPAGSPLHAVRLAKERIELVVPGVDNLSLRLGFAEDRLADARAGHDPSASLAEAASLLAAVHDQLPADQSAAVWTRWAQDESQLAALEAEEQSKPPAFSASPSPRTSPESPGAPGQAGPSSASPRPSGHQDTGGSDRPSGHAEASGATPSPNARPGGDDHGSPEPRPTGSVSPSPKPGGETESASSARPSPSPLPIGAIPTPPVDH